MGIPRNRYKCADCGKTKDGKARSTTAKEFSINLKIYADANHVQYSTTDKFCNTCHMKIYHFAKKNKIITNNSSNQLSQIQQADLVASQDGGLGEQIEMESEALSTADDGKSMPKQQNVLSEASNRSKATGAESRAGNFGADSEDVGDQENGANESAASSENLAILNVETTYSQGFAPGCRKRQKKVLGGKRKRTIFCQKGEKVFIPDVKSIPCSEKWCFICNSTQDRKSITFSEIEDMWNTDRILIPRNARRCTSHSISGRLTTEVKEDLKKKAIYNTTIDPREFGKLLHRFAESANRKCIDVDSEKMEDNDYLMLLGVTKDQFQKMFDSIKAYLRDTTTRSARTALAVLLAKLRLGVSQRLLGYMFGIDKQRKVSAIITRVTGLLDKYFVPQHLGFGNISRDTILERDDVQFIRDLLEVPEGSLCLFLDGTYLFVQKSGCYKLQRKTYNLHKYRNLLKVMMIVLPSGRILSADGLYFSDYANSDSEILKHMLEDPEGITSTIHDGDHFVVDRGFQNVIQELRKKYKLTAHMPSLMKKNKPQFTTAEANATRKVTMIRWIVEAANGKVKNVFKFFDQVIPAHYYIKNSNKKLGAFFRIACSVLNAFYPPIFVDNEKHRRILEAVKKRTHLKNTLHSDVKKKNLFTSKANWTEVKDQELQDFPKLNEEELFDLTLGIYQIRNARNYTREYFQDNGYYKLLTHVECDGMLRARLQSRFHKNQRHDVWLEYGTSDSEEKIKRYYCTCKVGTRTLGCCSHIASIVWYLGFRRHEPIPLDTVAFGADILNAAERRAQTTDEYWSEDDIETDVDDVESLSASQVIRMCQIENVSGAEDSRNIEGVDLDGDYDGYDEAEVGNENGIREIGGGDWLGDIGNEYATGDIEDVGVDEHRERDETCSETGDESGTDYGEDSGAEEEDSEVYEDFTDVEEESW